MSTSHRMPGAGPSGTLSRLGAWTMDAVSGIGRALLFLLEAVLAYPRRPVQLAGTLAQVHFIGARSMLVIAASGTFTGMVIALQFHDTLLRFGSVGLIGSAVGLSLVRELAPVLTALMVIGRAGSAITAEVAVMRSEEQIDALECMSIDPMHYLIAPRIAAALIAVPLLCAVFVTVGLGGGWLVAVALLDVGHGTYVQGVQDGVLSSDLAMCACKSLVFALIMVWTATYRGYFMHLTANAALGAAGVSRTTTDAVVMSAISVLFADYLVSALLL